jgi:glucose/arabinose dehydrogenase
VTTQNPVAAPSLARTLWATGEFEDFLVGFVTQEGNVWGRPVGVAVAKDVSLMVTDDGPGTVWRVASK